MPFNYKKFRIQQEKTWLPVQDNGRPSGGLTLAVLELCGFEIRNVSRTVVIDAAKHRLRERLLLIPEAIAKTLKAASLNPARFRGHIVDKKSGEEFVAILLSQTRPRLVHKGARPAQPAMPPAKINPELLFAGNGAWILDENTKKPQPVVLMDAGGSCPSEEEMSKKFVKVRRTNPRSLFVYGQVVSQLDLVRENHRLTVQGDVEAIQKWGFIQAAPFNHDNPRQIIPDVVPFEAPAKPGLSSEEEAAERKKLQEALGDFND